MPERIILETERLLLREFTADDFDALYAVLSDPEIMRHYPRPFDAEMTENWIARNLARYRTDGFGLWAVIRKDTGCLIGDCGLTMQMIDGERLPEIGYHIGKSFQRRGYAKEAALTVRDTVFRSTAFDALYAYMKYTNAASCATAVSVGMKKVKEYPDPVNTVSYVYAITRAEWQEMMQQPRVVLHRKR